MTSPKPGPNHPLLLVAIDGLRYDFLSPDRTPHLWALAQEGTWSPGGMQCQFPAQTSPNFRSIVTGLHVENHGILDNVMQDVESEEWFDYFGLFFDTEPGRDPKWYDGKVPIWTTFNRQTGGKSGSVYFPFTNVRTQSTEKLYYVNEEACEHDMDPQFLKDKIDLLIDWFQDKTDPIKFGMFYFSEPDLTSHYEDIYGPVVAEKITTVDNQVGHLVHRLKQVDLYGKVNMVFVSDHGYTNAHNPETHVDLITGVDPGLKLDERLTVCTGHPVGLKLKRDASGGGDIKEIFEYLKEYSKDKPVDIYTKDTFPKRYHYAGHKHVGDIIYTARFGYVALVAPQAFHYYGAKNAVYGEHGFKPEFTEMRPIFFAHGPGFRRSFQMHENFENIDLYPLMCKILGITPEKNDGEIARVEEMLADSSKL